MSFALTSPSPRHLWNLLVYCHFAGNFAHQDFSLRQPNQNSPNIKAQRVSYGRGLCGPFNCGGVLKDLNFREFPRLQEKEKLPKNIKI